MDSAFEKKGRLLIIEDEEAILKGLCDVFVYNGYEVVAERNGMSGLARALAEPFDLLILDLMLPGKDGLSICQEVRQAGRDLAVIMLTARTSDADIINGFSLGADDYVTKPFSVAELTARVEAVLRRTRRAMPDQPFSLGPWRIDPGSLSAVRTDPPGGSEQFTKREMEVLLYLKGNLMRPVPRAELLAEVWGYRRAARVETRTVEIHIAKLRRKLEADPSAPSLILTIRASGYQLKGLEDG